ncbi:MAG: hypothetical protein R2839_07420 [Thermomicrobiales bacterium]
MAGRTFVWQVFDAALDRLLIDAGEWIRIEECERRAEDLTRETVSLSSAR